MRAMIATIVMIAINIASILSAVNKLISGRMGEIIWIAPARHEIGRVATKNAIATWALSLHPHFCIFVHSMISINSKNNISKVRYKY